MTVKSILREKGSAVHSLTADRTLQEVAGELSKKRIGAVVILDGEALVGIVSERDIVRAIGSYGAPALDKRVTDVMTRRVEVARLDDPIDSVMERMTSSRFRHMPIVENGRLIGLVSIGDVVKRRIDDAERERDEMREYILNT